MKYEQMNKLWVGTDKLNVKSELFLMFLIGLVLGIISPYESSDVPFPLIRFSYWQLCVLFGWALAVPVARLILPRAERHGINPFSGFLLFCCMIAVPVFILVMFLDLMIFHFLLSDLPLLSQGTLNGFFERAPDFADSVFLGLVVWYFQVLVIVFLVFGAIVLLDEKFGKKHGEEGKTVSAPGQVFLDRLPADMNKKISCLSVEDHYVRVYSGSDDCLLLMRMTDAVAELADYAGMQVHRSWWVAFDAIEKRERDGRRYLLTLKDGRKVPVSKTYLAALKEKGY